MRLVSVILFAISAFAGVDDITPPASWSPTSPLAEARYNSCAASLPDGRILITGGTGTDATLASAEIYQPADGAFIQAAAMIVARSGHICAVLADGRVLVAGGESSGAAELYDPSTDSWQPVDGTGEPRLGPAAVLLRDRRVLIVGGSSPDDGTAKASIDVFNPQDGTLTPFPATLSAARDAFAAVLQNDGTVLFIGGVNSDGVLSSTDLFSPADDSIVPGPVMNIARTGHSATLLLDGTILIAGGFDGTQELDSAELYDPVAGAFQLLAAKLQTARRDHFALLAPGNGGVILGGGRQGGQALAATDYFQPVDRSIVALGDLTAPRSGITAAAISGGTILATGGLNENGPQAACGVLLLPAIQFTKALYRPGDTVQLSGSNFRPNTKINFALDLLVGTVVARTDGRLLTTSVTTPQGSQFQLLIGFAAVPILATTSSDPGKTVLVVARLPDGTTVQTTAPIRVATTLTINTPTGLYEGLNGTFLAQLTRTPTTIAATGLFALGFTNGCPSFTGVTDGTSNTIILSESSAAQLPNSVSSQLNTVSTSAFLSEPLTGATTTAVKVVASYSGDSANDPATASACFQAISRTPSLQLTTPGISLPVGSPFNLTAVVHPQPGTPQPTLTGSVNFFLGGFLLGPPQNSAKTNSPPVITATRQFTPLSVGPVTFTAQYTGDAFFNNASSQSVSLNIQKANTSLAFLSPPTTFHCDGPFSGNVQLSFPATLGLANTNVSVQTHNTDGSVRSIAGANAGLTVVNPGLGTGTLNIPSLPSMTTSLNAVFSGDALLQPSQSASVPLTLIPSQVAVEIQPVQGPQTNPVTLRVKVTPQGCSTLPTGSLEILDGGAPVAVVQIPNVLQVDGSAIFVSVQTSRPPGTRAIQVSYSGDRVYQSATSPTANITFQ